MTIFSNNFYYKSLKNLILNNPQNTVINWSLFKKSILILICGFFLNLQWVSWKIFTKISSIDYLTNQVLLQQQIKINLFFIFTFFILIAISFKFQAYKKIRKTIPFVAGTLLTVSLCREIYLVGVLNPSTMILYICLFYIGRIILPRKFIYLFFVPLTLFIIICCYLIFTHQLPYGPIFNVEKLRYTSLFWFSIIIYLIVPILCISLVIFEILLQQQHLQEQLIYKLSYLDPLTNLANRRTINTCLQQLNQSELPDYSIILLDIDHFKEVNDRYGHHTGDQVLIHVAKILKEHTQPYDLVGRFGGEEFILILKDTSLVVAQETAMQCKNAIEHMHMYSQDTQQYFFITASLGVAMAEGDLPPQQILSQADQALYQAKFSGRNQVKVFQSDL